MAVVEPYAPCPCGSGEKFKWCCQKIETYAERAKRLFEGGQISAAISALDEGLRKEPNNAWLLTRKALYLVQKNEPGEAKALLRRVIQKQPKHFGAHFLLTRLILETEGPVEGAAQLQVSLSAFDREERGPLAKLAQLVGAFLAETGHYPAALNHLILEQQLGADAESMSGSVVRMIGSDPSISAWLKDPYQIAPPPEGTSGEVRSRFLHAQELASQGVWSSAAVAFHELSTDPGAGAEAIRNVGICRLCLADDAAAADAIRRYLDRTGSTTDAVELAGLYQLIVPTSPDDQVEQVQWIWPLRDREALLASLRGTTEYREEGRAPIDPDDPDSPEVDQFSMLDRPMAESRPGLKAGELPRFVGRLLVGQEIVALESFDDGRLDTLAGRFRDLAGASVAPAHPKTKVLGTVPRESLALSWELVLPDGLDRDEVRRIRGEQRQVLLGDVWPDTPLPYLGGRTPLQAAAAGDAEVMLRAAVFRLELADPGTTDFDFGTLRARLNIGPEPAVDPQTVDLARLHASRLGLVPTDGLDDVRLVELYIRAKGLMQLVPLERAALALIDRPEACAKAGLTTITLYSDLVVLASSRGDDAGAFDWLRRGRQADPSAVHAQNAPVWDMLEIRLKSGSQPPESWVPELAVVLDRYREDKSASQKLILSLIDMGLIRMVRNPGDPEDVMIDPSTLEALLSRYGPRVTTASGQLGVAATRGEIWTPGSQAGGGAIWTPGSGPANPAAGARPAPGAEAPRLIIPGR